MNLSLCPFGWVPPISGTEARFQITPPYIVATHPKRRTPINTEVKKFVNRGFSLLKKVNHPNPPGRQGVGDERSVAAPGQSFLVELRVVSRPGYGPDIDHEIDSKGLKNGNEPVKRSVGMAYGVYPSGLRSNIIGHGAYTRGSGGRPAESALNTLFERLAHAFEPQANISGHLSPE